MKLWLNILIMMVASFILQYYVMSLIMTNDFNNITNSVGKLYISIIMAIFMGLTEIAMYDHMSNRFSWNYYGILGGFLIIFIFMYKKQIGIYDKEYISEMIEHHSMALLTSKEILNKTNNYKMKRLASNIINTQQEEITYMKNLL